MSANILRYAKFAGEDSFLESPTPTPEFVVDIESGSLDVPSDTQMMFEGGIGRGPRTHRPGFYAPSGNVVYAADVHTLSWFLKWALGGYAFTSEGGAGSLNLHESWGATDTELDSFVTWLGKDIFEQVVHGCMVSQLQLQVSDGYASMTVDIAGAKDAKGTLDEEVLDQLPAAVPLTFPDVRVWIGGTDAGDERSAKISDLTLTINNNGDASAARGLGSRFPQRILPAGQRDTTVQFTSWYDSTEHIERVWGDENGPSDDGTTELPLRIVADSGDDGSLTVDLPRLLFTQVQQQPSGRSRIDQTVQATALLDTVTLDDGTTEVESEILCALENDRGEVGA